MVRFWVFSLLLHGIEFAFISLVVILHILDIVGSYPSGGYLSKCGDTGTCHYLLVSFS